MMSGNRLCPISSIPPLQAASMKARSVYTQMGSVGPEKNQVRLANTARPADNARVCGLLRCREIRTQGASAHRLPAM